MRCYDRCQILRLLACVALGCSGVMMIGQVPTDGHDITARTGTVTVSVSGQTDFANAIANLKFSNPNDQALLPFGIVIQNQGMKSVVAYSLQWVFDSGAGSPIVKEQMHVQPFALDDGAKFRANRFHKDVVLAPGRSRFLTPAINFELGPGNHQADSSTVPSSNESAQMALARFADYQKQQPFRGVRLAAYVFQDGECVQIVPSPLCASLQAQVSAIQDLLQATTKQVFNGNNEAFMSSVAAVVIKKEASELEGNPIYQTYYQQNRDYWLRVLRRLLDSSGYEQLMLGVQQRKYATRPSIKVVTNLDNNQE